MNYRIRFIDGQISRYATVSIDDLHDFENNLESSKAFLKIKDIDGDVGFINKNMITGIFEVGEYR